MTEAILDSEARDRNRDEASDLSCEADGASPYFGGNMYEVYKLIDGEWVLISYCDNPMDGAQIIEQDIQDSDDNTAYRLCGGPQTLHF